jgi:hypothetical protein
VPCQTRASIKIKIKIANGRRRRGGEVRGEGRKTYLEEGMEALFCSLFLEAFLLFRTEVARLFGLLYLVEHGFELNC